MAADLPDPAQNAPDPEEDAFWLALIDIIELSPAQATRLQNQDVRLASHLSYLDDDRIASCFTANLKPTTGKLLQIIAFQDWIRKQQSILGFGQADSSNFTVEARDGMLMRIGMGKQKVEDFKSQKDLKDLNLG